jgi:hypothetical protein
MVSSTVLRDIHGERRCSDEQIPRTPCPHCGLGTWFRDPEGKLRQLDHDLSKHPGREGKALADS